jgi:hypothetical protein
MLLGMAVALTLGAAAPAATAAPMLKSIWGPMDEASLRSYEDLGVDVIQVYLYWDRVAPSEPAVPTDPADPAYRWPAELNRGIRRAREHGLDVALQVSGSPPWANGGRSRAWMPDPSRYADFMTAATSRYPRIRRWMVWGEANREGQFEPLPQGMREGPRAYARLLDSAYQAIKTQNPENIVIGGMTFSFGEVYPAYWLRWMRLPNGRPPRLDEYGHNPFTARPPDIRLRGYRGEPGARDISDLDTFAREVRRTYRPIGLRPKLWVSEFTISSDRGNRAFFFYVSRSEQARWLRDAFDIGRRVGAAGFGWFNFRDESGPRGLTTGLVTADGRRKPAYRAYRAVP